MTQTYPSIYLKTKREASVLRRHPWIFSGAIARVEGSPQAGELVAVRHYNGEFLAWGHFSPKSQIRVRLITWQEDDSPAEPEFWRTRLQRAINARQPLLADGQTDACRLVHAESDGLPGLIVDRYDKIIVVQYLSVGVEAQKAMLNEMLCEITDPQSLYERSDANVRRKEGLTPHRGLLHGAALPDLVEIRENGFHFLVNVKEGHKSGFYLDQRANRQRVRQTTQTFVRAGKMPHLLNVFAYTGGFAVYGMGAGASRVVNVDTSDDALQLGQKNLELNGFSRSSIKNITGDAFETLRELRQAEQRFDMIVLDPPKFASTKKDVKRAARGYKDINMQAFHLLRPGGILFTFSCSGAISADLFQKIVFGAALDSQRDAQIIGTMTQGSDHPVALTFPEGAYLKGLVCRVIT